MSNSPKKNLNNNNNPQDLNNLICATCQKPGRYRCSGCHKVTYCGALCQKKHWPLHKDECLEIRKQAKSIEKKTQKQQRLSKKMRYSVLIILIALFLFVSIAVIVNPRLHSTARNTIHLSNFFGTMINIQIKQLFLSGSNAAAAFTFGKI